MKKIIRVRLNLDRRYVVDRLILAVAADVRRRFNSEPTEMEALGLALLALPIGLAAIVYGLGL